MKNRKLLLIVSLVLALTMSLGGTLAYLTDTDADVNVMTLGSVKIEQHEYQRVQNTDGTYKSDTIDNVPSYVLEPFQQNKPLLPMVPISEGDPNNGYDSTEVRLSQLGHNSRGGMQILKGKNIQDKFVVVENKGVSDAYVRTYVAFEAGSVAYENYKSLMDYSFHFTWLENPLEELVNINGNNYYVVEFVYDGYETVQHPDGKLTAGDYTYNSLAQVYIKSDAKNEDLEAIDGNKNGKMDIIVLSQAVQADGFTDANAALTAGFGDPTANSTEEAGKTKVQVWLENASTTLPKVATTTEELSAEIATGKEEVVLAAGNYTMPNADIKNQNLTITGTKDTVIDMTHVYDNGNQSFSGATMVYDGVTLNFGTVNYKGLAHTESVTFKNCTINGLQFLNAGDFTFENCILNSNGAEHCFWTWGAETVTVTNCDFVYGDRAVNCYAEHGETTAITFNDCTFTKVAGKETTGAIETNSSLMTSLSLNINDCSVNEGDLWWVSSWDDKQGANTTVNGQPAKAN